MRSGQVEGGHILLEHAVKLVLVKKQQMGKRLLVRHSWGSVRRSPELAALETGVPVSFGVLTLDRIEQADARIEKGAEAVRTALEMADVFAHLRAAASRGTAPGSRS